MESAAEDRVGVLIVRAWLEPGSDPPLRVRITSSLDIGRRQTLVAATTDVDEACESLRGWLVDFLAGRRPGRGGG